MKLMQCVVPGAGEGGCVGESRGPDRDMAGESLELRGDGVEDDGRGAHVPPMMTSSGSQSDHGGEDADRLARVARRSRACASSGSTAASSAGTSIAVDGMSKV